MLPDLLWKALGGRVGVEEYMVLSKEHIGFRASPFVGFPAEV